MRSILSEYGLAVMYVIAVVSVLTIIFFAVNNEDTGIVTTYNTNMVYANDFYNQDVSLATQEGEDKLDNIDAINNTVNTIKKPTFMVDATASNDDYILKVPTLSGSSKVYYSYSDWLSLFSVNGKISLVKWNKADNKYVNVGLPSDVEVVITKMIPTVRGVDGALATEWVVSRDKYGNIMKDASGNPIMVEQIVYREEVYNRSNASEFFIDYDVACRYRVLFRYTDGAIKSEYSAMFANKIRPAEEIYEEVYTEWVEY